MEHHGTLRGGCVPWVFHGQGKPLMPKGGHLRTPCPYRWGRIARVRVSELSYGQ